MSELEISDQELSRLTEEALALAGNYWASIEERPAYPATSGKSTTEPFSRPWREDGLGRQVLSDFKTIADHSRPSGGKFFGYVFGSGEPVGALGELLAAALNQNVSSWRSGPAATSIEHAVVDWLAEAVGCVGFDATTRAGLMSMAQPALRPGRLASVDRLIEAGAGASGLPRDIGT